MSTTLPLFWHLSSASKKERIDASVKLVGALEQFQAQKTAAKGDDTNDEEDEEDEDDPDSDSPPKTGDDLDTLNAQDVAYSLRRLIRGLASPRESSRLGFAVALTELLSRLDTITAPQIVKLVLDSTKVQGSMNGQEERDVLFARLFGVLSVIQSGLAFRTGNSSTKPSSASVISSAESFEEIINTLVTLGDQKSWLRESSWFALHQAFDGFEASSVSWEDEGYEKAVDALFVKNATWSTEKLALALKLQDSRPDLDWKQILSPTFKGRNILGSTNLATVARILKESATDEDGTKDSTKASSGGWKPQLNFSWDIILDQLLPPPNSKKAVKGSFQDFHRVAVDESLFSSSSSANKKYWGFQAFQKALRRVDTETMPMLFTKNFMRTWINHLSKKDRYLHKIAVQTATEVQAFVKGKPELGFPLILNLTGAHGSQQFDKLTKTKTVETILSKMDANGVKEYINHLLGRVNVADDDSSDVATINARRTWIIEQLTALIRNHKLPRDDVWIKTILDWLVVHGLFTAKKKSSKSPFVALHTVPKPVFSDDLRQTCREKLLICLADLCHQVVAVTEGDSTQKLAGVTADGEFWISKVVSTIRLLEEDAKHVALLAEPDEDGVELREEALKVVDAVHKVSTDSSRGIELLVLGTLLNHYSEAESEDSETDALQTCIEASSLMLRSEGKKKKKKDEELPEPIDILVDVIIGFLEKGTSYLRTIANQTFSLLSGSMKESTIDLIVTQLERRNPSQLLANEEEDEDDDMEGPDDGDGDDSEDESSGSESEPEESEPDEDTDTALELSNKITEALRINGIEPATGETDSEEEILMDDDQMMAIDEQLADVFRSHSNEKKSSKVDAQREATHFKNRVLDLVDTYLKKQSSNALTLRLILPLLDLLVGSGPDEQQLVDKTRGIIRSRFSKVKEVPTTADIDQVTEIATAIHVAARKAKSADMLNVLGLCNVHVTKVLLQAGGRSAIVDLAKEDLVDFTTRKNSGLNGAFFIDFIKKQPAIAWDLRQDLLDALDKALNAYRQSQVFEMLEQLLNLLHSFNPPAEQVTTFMIDLRQSLFDISTTACSESGNLSTAHFRQVLKLALLALRQTCRIDEASAESIWLPDRWQALQATMKTSPQTKSCPVLIKLCDRIGRMSLDTNKKDENGKSTTKKAKRKAEESLKEDDGRSPTKQKRKKAKFSA